jgi:hypothetical protein
MLKNMLGKFEYLCKKNADSPKRIRNVKKTIQDDVKKKLSSLTKRIILNLLTLLKN